MSVIDLNADVGEGGDDLPLLRVVSSVNIACGGHAGDPGTMERLVQAARTRGLAIGAHPGFRDPVNFGRMPVQISAEDVERLVADQVLSLEEIAGRCGARVTHVKPHGALYNQAAADPALAAAVAAGTRRIGSALRLVGLAGSRLIEAGRAAGLAVAEEGFCDRRYRADGTLQPRSEPGAVLTDPSDAAAQAVAIARGEPILTEGGGRITVRAETLCIHGGTPAARAIAEAVGDALREAGFRLRPLPAIGRRAL